MKLIHFILPAILACAGNQLSARSVSRTFKVYGNCGMCKMRIEKAAAAEGVSLASWHTDTKIMTVTYDSSKITTEGIQKRISAAGHDTEGTYADDAVYEQLPGCCLYERRKKTGNTPASH